MGKQAVSYNGGGNAKLVSPHGDKFSIIQKNFIRIFDPAMLLLGLYVKDALAKCK